LTDLYVNKAAIIAFTFASSLWIVSTATADCRVARSGWALKPVKHGEIGELHWATANYSERWITIKPVVRPKEQKAAVPEILLIFSVCFPGKNQQSPLSTAQIRAQINRDFIPASVPPPKIEISLSKQPFSELTKLFPRWTVVADGCLPADGCAYEAIIVEVPISFLGEMAAASVVVGEVSGTQFEITPLQREQLGQFVQVIGR
jgi:hypothetical protein